MFTSTQQQKEAVRQLVAKMIETPTDTLLTYGELSAAAGRNVRDKDRWILQRAWEIVLKEQGAVFAPVRGEGLRRLSGVDGTMYLSNRGMTRTRRAARLGSRRTDLAARFANDLSPEQGRVLNNRRWAFSMVQHLTHARTVATFPADEPPPNPDGLAGLKRALGL